MAWARIAFIASAVLHNSPARLPLSSETFRYASIMLLAGIGIPMMAVLNTQLGKGIGSPAAAATVLFTVALLATVVVMYLTGGPAPLRLSPPSQFISFLLDLGWFFTCCPSHGLRRALELAMPFFCVLLGQMIAATAIDHFGLFGALARPLTLQRASGISFMVLGVSAHSEGLSLGSSGAVHSGGSIFFFLTGLEPWKLSEGN